MNYSMEWKIGEIKWINGEWYQCIKSITCNGCGFNDKGCTADRRLTGDCSGRLDGTPVIFKKLEKIGKPYMYKGRFVQPYKRGDDFILFEHGSNNIIDYKHE